MATSEFPSFPRLPPEIRLMIWNAALPGPINNPLFFWRTDKVIKHRLDDKYDDYDNWVPDLIHPLEMGIFSVEIPLLEVSKEAHKVAQEWVQRQSLSLEVDVDNDTYTENHNRLAMRRFNLRRNIVFCPGR
ncbi:2EXR domain-containing protein [Aspergillus brunneoviolaceus CBS 621.78]|uniref:Uncharacterized protein n=1 Tax=Aspergillus brunneoviolaceus CBS 621.78 TaxID=1450534 RepID=A0ACD1G7P2_9EURO|nr:hypothetical protein BO95DRAFT_464066 [Aspergillus brunneoviolaceus CBS 621.78]RAH45253.1 hypothetical protein BO95DRAFT_464066 [Aspergillus brunneoviolaceus CBS 621.78]